MEHQALNRILLNLSELSMQQLQQSNKHLIKCYMEQIFEMSVRSPNILAPDKFHVIVNNCCQLIPIDDVELIKDFCRIINGILQNSLFEVEIETSTLLIQWCLEAFNSNVHLPDILQIIDTLLRRSALSEALISSILKGLESVAKEKSIGSFYALKCVNALIENNEITCSDIFFEVLKQQPNGDCCNDLKRIIVCLRGLKSLINKSKYLEKNLGLILGIIKTFMLYNIIDYLKPTTLLPSVMNIPEASGQDQKICCRAPPGKSVKPKDAHVPLHVRINGEKVYVQSSDYYKRYLPENESDNFDVEKENDCGKLSFIIRKLSLEIFLQIMPNTTKYVMFSFWTNFIPEKSQLNGHYLTTCILKDTAKECKILALNILQILLASSKSFLLQAEKSSPNVPFTPFCVVLCHTICELYKCLALALSEQSVPVLTQVLKCFASLTQATPFHKLPPGLMTKLVRNVKVHATDLDSTVQVAALGVLECVLLSKPTITETQKLINFEGTPDFNLTGIVIPWPIEICVRHIGERSEHVAIAVKLESLKVICALTVHFFINMTIKFLSNVGQALAVSFTNSNHDVRLHSCKAVYSIGQCINRYLSEEAGVEKPRLWQNCYTFWREVYPGIYHCITSDNKYLIAAACDALGTMGERVFAEFEKARILPILFENARNKDDYIKAAAVGILATFTLYPTAGEDFEFLTKLKDIIQVSFTSHYLILKIKASWALANLCEALQVYRCNLERRFTEQFLYSIFKMNMRMTEQCDKIQVNVVRALGYVIQLVNAKKMEKLFQCEIREAVDVLRINAITSPNVKVRWNACKALGNVLKNATVYKFIERDETFKALIESANHENLKVRINTAYALSCPPCRKYYENFYIPAWFVLLEELERIQNMTDSNQLLHREQLRETICVALVHLLSLATEFDVIRLKETVEANFELLKQNMDEVFEKLLPQKTTAIFEAKEHLEKVNVDAENTQLLFELFSKFT